MQRLTPSVLCVPIKPVRDSSHKGSRSRPLAATTFRIKSLLRPSSSSPLVEVPNVPVHTRPVAALWLTEGPKWGQVSRLGGA